MIRGDNYLQSPGNRFVVVTGTPATAYHTITVDRYIQWHRLAEDHWTEPFGDAPVQQVGMHDQLSHFCERCQSGGKGAREAIFFKPQRIERCQGTKLAGDRLRQVVETEGKVGQQA